MNITFSVEDEVAERARKSAVEMGETLEQALENCVWELADRPKRSELLPERQTLRERIYR
jgi:post-segregation antitoxin (ccd killing protein)